MSRTPEATLAALADAFRAKGSVLVAFSGGVDSAVLAKVGADVLGARCLAVLVDSESVAPEEREAAVAFAREAGIPVEVRWHSELADPRYAANPLNRCYFCRQGLSDVLFPLAAERGLAAVAVGTNADDGGDFRPGEQALAERGAWKPLAELGVGKAEVRAMAKLLGLPVWDKPSMACLSSRIPYGEPITLDKLTRVGRAEAILRDAGFRQVRVRTFGGDRARVEVLPDEVARLEAMLDDVRARMAALGYVAVEVDPRGYRTGAMHEGLRPAAGQG